MSAMMKSCTCPLERAGERNGVGDFTDRLSNLPDFLLYQILSLLETKYAVQTSVLSRRWRCAWKYVPALRIWGESFREYSIFESFVDKVLSLRYQVNVNHISYAHDPNQASSSDLNDRVIEYAFSHHTQHLYILICDVQFSELFGSRVNCDLKTLEMCGMYLHVGSCCFEMLTTLKLEYCILDIEQDYDLSLNLPLLMNLKISYCSSVTRVKVFASQLRTLKFTGHSDLDIEVVAPKLEFFRLIIDPNGMPKVSLPYVDLAELMGDKKRFGVPVELLVSHLNFLFPGLHGAKSLLLRCRTTEGLKEICNYLEQKPFCFPKLESLVCLSDKPYEVVSYQVEGGVGNAKNFRRRH